MRGWKPPGAKGTVADILAAAFELRDRLDEVLGRLDSLGRLAGALRSGATQLAATLEYLARVTAVASEASQRVERRAPILASTARAMDGLGRDLREIIRPLADRLAEVRAKVMELRFLISLGHLHDDMVISFALEVLEGLAPPDGLSYVPLLCRALTDDVVGLAGDLETAAGALGRVAAEVEACSSRFAQFQKLLTAWRLQVPRYGLSATLGPLVGPIDAQLSRGHDELAALKSLAGQCDREARPGDQASLRDPIDRISGLASDLLGGDGSDGAGRRFDGQLPGEVA